MLAVAGCGDDEDGASPTPGTGGATGGSSGAGTGGGGTAGGGTSSGGAAGSTSSGGAAGGNAGEAGSAGMAGNAGASASLTCDAYCTAIMANCTGGNLQFENNAQCLAVCATYPEGTLADTVDNTLGCRLYHATAAATGAALHCPHAGPAGGGATFCGTNCEGYCNIMLEVCDAEYADANECLTTCEGFTNFETTSYSYQSAQPGNTFECRLKHASNAATADSHCAHAGENPTDICN
jgi:hypothetical protein